MTLLVLALLAAPPVAPTGVVVFDRLKKLEGNWKSKDGQSLSVRVTASGRAVVGSLTGADHALVSVTVFHLEGTELVAAFDGALHGALRLSSATERLAKLEARSDPSSPLLWLSLVTKDADSLTFAVTTRNGANDVEEATALTREYVETLK
jgi:hypothetical protein